MMRVIGGQDDGFFFCYCCITTTSIYTSRDSICTTSTTDSTMQSYIKAQLILTVMTFFLSENSALLPLRVSWCCQFLNNDNSGLGKNQHAMTNPLHDMCRKEHLGLGATTETHRGEGWSKTNSAFADALKMLSAEHRKGSSSKNKKGEKKERKSDKKKRRDSDKKHQNWHRIRSRLVMHEK
eukprot:3974269-Ditylum_brightwellii.AAC.1